eukprot:533796_1
MFKRQIYEKITKNENISVSSAKLYAKIQTNDKISQTTSIIMSPISDDDDDDYDSLSIPLRTKQMVKRKARIKTRNELLQTEYVAYNINSSVNGLFKSIFKWILLQILLFIVMPPSLVMMVLCYIIFIYPLYKRKLYYGWTPLFVLLMMIVSLSYLVLKIYYTHTIVTHSFYSLIPIIQSVLFKDAVVEFVHLRLYFLNIYKCFTGYHSNKLCSILCIPNIIKHVFKNYWIWGTSIQDYAPYGTCSTVKGRKTTFDECIAFEDLKKYHIFKIMRLLSLYKLYSKSQLVFLTISMLSSIMYLTIPSIYFFMKGTINYSMNIVVSISIFAIVSIFNIWVIISIFLFIEVIFYRLQEYYVYMYRLTKMININANTDRIINKSYCNMDTFIANRFEPNYKNSDEDDENEYNNYFLFNNVETGRA